MPIYLIDPGLMGQTMLGARFSYTFELWFWNVFWHALTFVVAGPVIGMIISPAAPFLPFAMIFLPMAYLIGAAPAVVTGLAVGAIGPVLPIRPLVYLLAGIVGFCATGIAAEMRGDTGTVIQLQQLSGVAAALACTFFAKRITEAATCNL